MTFDQIPLAAPLPAKGLSPKVPEVRQDIDRKLEDLLTVSPVVPANLAGAVRHIALAPGKRMRALLLYLIAEPAPAQRDAILSIGCAVEMVHAASLILDDLPCMDDAQIRRQQPATHIAFSQSTAILGAIALLARAFEVISGLETLPSPIRCRLSQVLSNAVGWNGLSAGQEQDVNGQASIMGADEVETVNWLKTGVLFVAAAEMGAIARGMDEARIQGVRRYASHLGQAFQIADDMLDFLVTADEAGKDVRQDKSKKTFVTLFGLSHAQTMYAHHQTQASRALIDSGVTPEPLEQLMSSVFSARNLPAQ